MCIDVIMCIFFCAQLFIFSGGLFALVNFKPAKNEIYNSVMYCHKNDIETPTAVK